MSRILQWFGTKIAYILKITNILGLDVIVLGAGRIKCFCSHRSASPCLSPYPWLPHLSFLNLFPHSPLFSPVVPSSPHLLAQLLMFRFHTKGTHKDAIGVRETNVLNKSNVFRFHTTRMQLVSAYK